MKWKENKVMENRKQVIQSNTTIEETKQENNDQKERKKACGLHCIRIQDFNVAYGKDVIIEHVNLHIHCGNLTAIIGKNGAGKSTLVKAIIGELPHTGSISFRDIRNNEFQNLKVGYVPQQLNIARNTPTSVYDLFAGFISKKPICFWKSKKTYQIIKQQLEVFKVGELIDRPVCDLSGGQLQRVLLSIATYPIPNLLVLDEPVSGIDHNGMELFYRNIEYLKKNYDMSIILISHDLDYIEKYADKVILLDKTIIKEGIPDEVFRSQPFKDVFGERKKV